MGQLDSKLDDVNATYYTYSEITIRNYVRNFIFSLSSRTRDVPSSNGQYFWW